jgi:uncharacterized membrane protein YhaH (DUF805 family)
MNVEKLPDLQAARIQVQDYDTSQMISYLLNNLRTAAVILFENIFRNFLSPSSYVDRNAYWSLFLYTLATNMSYTLLHLMFPPVIYLRRGDPLNHATKLYLVYIFFVLIAITSGISFFQGDRLIVVAIPLWLTVYLYSISSIRSLDQQIVTKQQPIISS